MNVNRITSTNGIEVFDNTTDASNVFQIKNAQGYIRMHSFNIDAYNTSNDSPCVLLLSTVSDGGVYLHDLGIGVIAGANRLSVGGGNSNFGGNVRFQASTTFNNEI